MHPAFSVIFLTTLIGAGQGLFLALYVAELACCSAPGMPAQLLRSAARCRCARSRARAASRRSSTSAGRSAPGARPRCGARRGCRARSSCCRRSWRAASSLWRRVAQRWGRARRSASARLTLVACVALFVCTGMIYACMPFLQEWASPLTLVNFALLGCGLGLRRCRRAGGVAGAARWPRHSAIGGDRAHARRRSSPASLSLARNARLAPEVDAADARSASSTRASCRNRRASWAARSTRASSSTARRPRGCARSSGRSSLLGVRRCRVAAARRRAAAPASAAWPRAGVRACSTPGLLAERWYFFAQAKHPQNLYYQAIS